MIQTLFHDLKQYYRGICFEAAVKKGLWPFNPLKKDMEEYVSAHPDITPFQVKAGLYDIIAEKCTPVLFKNDPFFFEVGLKMAEYDGHSSLSSGGWMFLNRFHLMKDLDPEGWNQYYSGGNMGLHLTFNIFDIDHHGFPYRNVLKNGLSGLYSQITEKLNTVNDPRKTDFYEAAKKGILAVKKIADRFSAEAERLAEQETDAAARETYLKAAAAAGRVPWNPAETFYEGLAVIWFLHEIGSVMDGIGMAIIGSPDDLLHDLYKHDVENGAETPESAEQLLKIWMIHTDCKLDFTKPGDKQFNAGEQGDTLTIGKDVNELTYMILKIHRELNLIYPKIHCRVNAASPEKYLREACLTFFDGKNTLDFLNDDLIIPAQILSGKDRADAERYVVGGCWEIMLSECEHAQGANCYFDLARVMDLSIQSTEQEEQSLGLHFERFDHADSFETLYGIVMRNVKMCLNQVFASLRKFGSLWPEINPAPFFSACMTGCIESGKDYSEGGAKYSPHSIPLTDAAAFVNSLLVLRELCFHTKKYELSEILNAVRSNWKGAEALRGE